MHLRFGSKNRDRSRLLALLFLSAMYRVCYASPSALTLARLFQSAKRQVTIGWSLRRSLVPTARAGALTVSCNESKTMVSLPHSIRDAPRSSSRFQAYIAVGSNTGDRFQNIALALHLLCDTNQLVDDEHQVYVHVLQTSFLHETTPMYVTDQPLFLNGAVLLQTNLSPHALLRRIKSVEARLGRDLEGGVRNGPRPVDLDILLYFTATNDDDAWSPVLVKEPDLTVPHPRMGEREFVLSPLCELKNATDLLHPTMNVTIGALYRNLKLQTKNEANNDTLRVLPLPRGRMLYFNRTLIMGILNVTPDSFSDGGKLKGSVDLAAQRAMQMEEDGADIIDIGGESTRPGAKEVDAMEEIERTVPVIQKIREVSDVPISIDTRHAQVAKCAVEAGADIVNDVSGGTFDPSMLSTVSALNVPIVLMHMRGTPETMQNLTDYDDVVEDVAASLLERSHAAEAAGIPVWMQVMDPGIGFAKDLRGNLLLLRRLQRLRMLLNNVPLLLGTSRKGFIGKVAGESNAEHRDFGTVASCVAALCIDNRDGHGCNILRVHNVRAMKQASAVMDAILDAK